jgi:hypothetical protein
MNGRKALRTARGLWGDKAFTRHSEAGNLYQVSSGRNDGVWGESAKGFKEAFIDADRRERDRYPKKQGNKQMQLNKLIQDLRDKWWANPPS